MLGCSSRQSVRPGHVRDPTRLALRSALAVPACLPVCCRYKPGPCDRAPVWVPWLHLPRLDWRLWFLALPSAPLPPWLFRLLTLLLRQPAPPAWLRQYVQLVEAPEEEEGEAGVEDELKEEETSKAEESGGGRVLVRVLLYRYHFHYQPSKRTLYWRRDAPRLLLKPTSLEGLEGLQARGTVGPLLSRGAEAMDKLRAWARQHKQKNSKTGQQQQQQRRTAADQEQPVGGEDTTGR